MAEVPAAKPLTHADLMAAVEKARTAPVRFHGSPDDPHIFHPDDVTAAREVTEAGRPYSAQCSDCLRSVSLTP